ncbi:allantoinase AllB [Paenibacillus antri]|uniref:Allantoinase n=1 Tax=Paenibacillus antri TaxID=2582848 RepID=A0A5R9G8K7_9BACL|nr:allantoinase AllB [Paenibacillus antri]TLS52742.1 allantoinase AllB [Paenibacillus antri]
MATYELVVTGGFVVCESGGVRDIDIGVNGGRIAALAPSLSGESTIDAAGCYVLPGMVDAHVHFNEPNFGHWEGFRTGSASLAAGGITTYIDMPLNGNPPTVTPAALAAKASLAEGASAVDYAFWGGLVPGHLDEIEAMASLGVVGFKAFMSSPGGEGDGRFREVDDATLFEGMRRIASIGGLLALHAESDSITSLLAADALASGRTSARDFAASRPIAAETEAVGRALVFAERAGCRLHFVHISSADAVRLIDAAKRRGQDVTVETCPHYLTLTEDDMASLGAVAKCAPPLRSDSERRQLWEQTAAGRIDLIASDHSPCPPELKEGSFFSAWGGISGAQSSLELLFDEAVLRRGLPPTLVAELTAAGPARRFGLSDRKGAIAVGLDADLAVLDPNRAYTLQASDLRYRHRHSPYLGRTLGCKIRETLLRGESVYQEETGNVVPGGGRFLRKS